MKRCPSCNRTFDDTQNFCLEDATPLISEASSYDPAKTVLATGPDAMDNAEFSIFGKQISIAVTKKAARSGAQLHQGIRSCTCLRLF